ncbi:MAG: molecular chaperone DnaJ [Croceibacterium sp.]
MFKLLIIAAVVCYGWKLVTGRWPWGSQGGTRAQAVMRARRLLGVSAAATREEIVASHRRLITLVHPDRGGSNGQVHEADAARDLLLDDLPLSIQE